MGAFKNLESRVFGNLQVVSRTYNIYTYNKGKISTDAYYKCKCICGKKVVRKTNYLTTKKQPSCGNKECRGTSRKDLTNKVFGRLTVIKYTQKIDKYGSAIWLCLCSCGKQKETPSDSLNTGKTKSCGCLQRETASAAWKNKDCWNKLPPGTSSFNSLYGSYRRGAKNRNIVFSLTKETFKIITQQNCYYCKEEPKQFIKGSKIKTHYLYNGIDRRDNNEGYTKQNALACCKNCNYAKQQLSESDFLSLIAKIYKNRVFIP